MISPQPDPGAAVSFVIVQRNQGIPMTSTTSLSSFISRRRHDDVATSSLPRNRVPVSGGAFVRTDT